VKGPVLVDGLLLDQNVVDGATLYFKDLGVQISWRLVFVLEYLGPCIIVPLFWFFPSIFYGEAALHNSTRSKTQM
jgi:very-long-chain enoyl-CoA reductase